VSTITSDNIGGKLDKTAGEPAPPGDGFKVKPSVMFTRELSFAAAQLRHAYMQLAAGTVVNQKEFAEGLISPQIERIEKVLRRLA
jgi:hypothetical protein